MDTNIGAKERVTQNPGGERKVEPGENRTTRQSSSGTPLSDYGNLHSR